MKWALEEGDRSGKNVRLGAVVAEAFGAAASELSCILKAAGCVSIVTEVVRRGLFGILSSFPFGDEGPALR
jgi:hypothetical protein